MRYAGGALGQRRVARRAFQDAARQSDDTLEPERDGGGISVVGGGAIAGDLDFGAQCEFLRSTGTPDWSRRLVDIEPHLDALARLFTSW